MDKTQICACAHPAAEHNPTGGTLHGECLVCACSKFERLSAYQAGVLGALDRLTASIEKLCIFQNRPESKRAEPAKPRSKMKQLTDSLKPRPSRRAR